MSRPNQLVGMSVERLEDRRFLTGRGRYVADIQRDSLLHAVIVRSSQAHGVLQGIDTTAARAIDGVVEIITAADLPDVAHIPLRQQILPEGEPYLQPVLAQSKVRYVGEPVAVVVARSTQIAEDAAGLIDIAIQPLPVVTDSRSASASQTLVFDNTSTNRAMVFTALMGDADEAFAIAPYVRRDRFSVQRHTALPMETRGLLAEWNDGRLVVHGAAKVPFFNRRLLARMLGLAESDVDMMEVDVGGGFGARGEFYPEDFLIPFLARRLKAPVRWIEDRHEHMMAMNHAREAYADLEIACSLDGKVLGLRGEITLDIGAYVRTNGFTGPRNAAQFLSGPYNVPNIKVDAVTVVTNKSPAGTYRGPGRFEASFFCERLFDMAADDLGIDPASFRANNLVAETQMPYKLAQMQHSDPSSETELDGGAYEIVLQRCLEEFGWKEKILCNGRLIDGQYHGLAVACFVEGGAAGPSESARMTLRPDGGVDIGVGSSAIGQGLETILCQIAADALELPLERLAIAHGSTTVVKEGFGSFHSRSTVMGGSAVLLAADALRGKIRVAAAQSLQCAAEDITLEDGTASNGTASIKFGELAEAVGSVEASFRNTKHTYSNGAHAVHVTVDAGTGAVTILDYLTVEDVGRVINPALLHGQVIGAVVQGLGSVFLEEIHYDSNGQILNASLADYLLPVATDFPRIRSISMGLRRCPNNPLGAKGAGEGGLIATGGVVCNAIAAALKSLGVQPRALPITPPRLLQLISGAQQSSTAV